jgi:hypothetical protein
MCMGQAGRVHSTAHDTTRHDTTHETNAPNHPKLGQVRSGRDSDMTHSLTHSLSHSLTRSRTIWREHNSLKQHNSMELRPYSCS